MERLLKKYKTIKISTIVIYSIAILFLLINIFTAYSPTNRFFNNLIRGILIGFPVIVFFIYLKPLWLKILTLAIALIGCIILGYYLLLIYAFTTAGDDKLIKKWEIDNYTVTLTSCVDWAGPRYYKYEIKQYIFNGLLEKYIANEFPKSSIKDTCIIDFKSSTYSTFKFDKCKLSLEKY